MESYVQEQLIKLNEKWQQFKDQVKQKRNALNQASEFFEVVEKVLFATFFLFCSFPYID